MTTEEWVDGNWNNSMKLTNTFDANGNIITESSESWDNVAKVWSNETKTTHTLNSNSTINYSMTQSWNPDQNMWEDMQKTVYTYDASKNVLTQKVQMFFGTDWMDFSLTTNTYNANNQMIKNLSQNYDFMAMQWQNFSQTNYTFNTDGTENQTTSQFWNSDPGLWENVLRLTNAYLSGKKISSMVIENYSDGSWVNFMKSAITYNADGTMKESMGQEWDVASGTWIDSGKEFYTIYPDGSVNQVLTTLWNASLSQWENDSRITYTYNSTFVHQTETDQLIVFPNPFADVISIEGNSLAEMNIQLYNANGQLIRIFDQSEQLAPVNLSGLKSGVYLLKVTSPESEKVIKLLKYK